MKGINGSTPAISLRLMKHKTKRFFSNRSPLQQNQKQKESRLREQNSFGVSVEVSDLSWSLKNNRKVVLHNVSFDLERGKTLGIVGPNGAGKTTLLRMLYHIAPTTGQVKIDGVNIWRMSPREVALQGCRCFAGTAHRFFTNRPRYCCTWANATSSWTWRYGG